MVKTKSLKQKNRAYWIKLFLSVAIFLTIIPIYYVIVNAFKDKNFILTSPVSLPLKTFTFDNVRSAFKSLNYPQAFMNSLINVIISCTIMIIVGSMAAYAISVVKSKELKIMYVATILVITIPFQVVMIPLVIMLKNLNLLNNYFGTSLVYVALSLPLVIFLYTGFMRSLPKELGEAAIVDGCGFSRTYLSIYMPLMKTVTGTILILRGTFVWNDLLISKITISRGRMTPLIPRLFSYASSQYNSWELMFAGTLLCAMPIIILFLFMQKTFIKGVVAGSVKG
ncbi:MAG TPA: carbohydrate ABC transporter permease [Clostridiaceae bacterium]|nr:carbohydrate ABC transporter permease [Clostridiaceae bacterium]